MIPKTKLKSRAIALRKRGLAYREILLQVPVAKSTLSLWLRSVQLAKRSQQRMTEKKRLASLRGGAARKNMRIATMERIINNEKDTIGSLTHREFRLIGTALYWAEGLKEKEYHPGSGVQFTNSDPMMILFFVRWLQKACAVPKKDVSFDLFIHDVYAPRVSEIKSHWSKCTGFGVEHFKHVYFKKHKPTTRRHRTGNTYYGVVKVCVARSSMLNRKIAGWIQGMIEYETNCRVV